MATAEDQPVAEAQEEATDTAPPSNEASEDKASTPPADGPSNDTTASETESGAVGVTKDNDDQQLSPPSDSAQPSAKKRRSNLQLNKDDHPEGCDSDGDDDINDEGGKRSDPFKRASEDVLKKRKIVKASSKWGSGGNGGTKNGGGGAFASVKLAPTTAVSSDADKSEEAKTTGTSVFGSTAKLPTFGSASMNGGSSTGGFGFGTATSKTGGFGFGSTSSGFGALKPSTDANDTGDGDKKSTGFGGGFGNLSTSSGFGALKSTTTSFGFGTASNGGPGDAATTSTNGSGLAGTFASSPDKTPSNTSPTKFPTSSVVDTANGEQDEDCLCQVRAKLFKMAPEDDTPETGTQEEGGDVPSVPSTKRLELVKAKRDENEGTPEKASPEKGGSADDNKPKMVQKEAGIGPVRVLKRKAPLDFSANKEVKDDKEKEPTSARVVQRQETSGGQATRVILNIRLDPKTCNVIRRGDKFVQLNAPNSDGTLESSLFKVKTTEEADKLENNLKAMLK